KTENGNISYYGGDTHIVNNYGLIKRSNSTGIASIIAQLNNNNGTIVVESGVLNFSTMTKNLTDGVYNVAAGASLIWNSQVVCAGNLTGLLNGEILWNNEVNVPTSTTATFNFTGSTGINWSDGSLRGGGTLVNQNEITLINTESKYLYDNTSLNNNGTINYESTGLLYITDGYLNNQTNGVIDLKSPGNNITYYGGVTHVFNNYGLLKCTTPSGTCTISAVLNNND